jgi:hypothetical protein
MDSGGQLITEVTSRSSRAHIERALNVDTKELPEADVVIDARSSPSKRALAMSA